MVLTCCYKIVHEVLSLIRLVVGFGHQHKVGTLKAYKNYPSCISCNGRQVGEVYGLKRKIMITDEIKFKGALKVDIIRVWNSTKTKFKDINEYDFFNEELSKLHQPTVIKNEVAVCPKCKSDNMTDKTGNIGTCFDCYHIWQTVL